MTDRFKNVVIDFLNENISTYCSRKECLNSIYKNTAPQRDWDFDSLDMINFIMYIEMRYKISINDKELK